METLQALKIKMEVLDQVLNDIDCIIEKNEVKKNQNITHFVNCWTNFLKKGQS